MSPYLVLAVIQQALIGKQWIRDLTGPFCVRAIVQYLHLWVYRLQQGTRDQICWRWTASMQYTAKLAYSMFFCGSGKLEGAKLLWALPRAKLFTFHRPTWTAERLKRHGLQENDTCVMCDQQSEHIEHLLLHYTIAKQIWCKVLRWISLPSRFVSANFGIAETWQAIRSDPTRINGKK